MIVTIETVNRKPKTRKNLSSVGRLKGKETLISSRKILPNSILYINSSGSVEATELLIVAFLSLIRSETLLQNRIVR